MKNITESLRRNDLRHLVKKTFDIDAYQSKIGNDTNVVVLSFTVESEDPAKDLENFVEMGYEFVLDADVSPGETDEGKYIVFVEIERNRHTAENIAEILDGIERLTGIPDMRFRYFKSFKSYDATVENLAKVIPTDTASYQAATDKHSSDNYSNFFSNSAADKISLDENLIFTKLRADPLSFRIINSGLKEDVYASIKGPIMIESKDIAEVMFYTKYIGNYNINKIGNTFIFENKGWAVAMERNNGI